MTYRREIDGLRAVALLPVIFYHAGFPLFSGAFVMLDVFFVISGYLISSLILKDLEKGTFSLVQFYERRARRILPALFFVMLCCIPFAWMWLMPLELTMFAKSLIAVCLFSSNFLFWKESGYFEPANELKPLLHTWSLAVEEQFYLIFPLLFLLAWKWKRKGLFLLILIASALSLATMQWGSLNSPDANYYLLPGRAWEFLLGMLITLVIQHVQRKAKELPQIASEIAALIGMTLLITSLFTFNKYEAFPSFFAFIPLIGTTLVILFATPKTFIGKLLCSPPLVGIGLISYSGYLWHQPLFAFARHALLREPEPWIFGLLILFNFILSYLSWKFVEQPFRVKTLFSRKRVFAFSAALSVLVISAGALGVVQRGFPNRLDGPVDFDELFSGVRQQELKAGTRFGGHFSVNSKTGETVDRFIEDWKTKVYPRLSRQNIKVAVFGSSHASNLSEALSANQIPNVTINGGGCSVDPNRVVDRSNHCKQLANAMKELLKSHTAIKYLVLVPGFVFDKKNSELDLISRGLDFWAGVEQQIILFSGRPTFFLLKQRLQRGEYPAAESELAEWSMRREVKDFLKKKNIHLVDSKQIFCGITPGCTFKLGNKLSFRSEDFLLWADGHHLSMKGREEFGRALIELDPLFKKIAEESKKTESNN